MSREGLGTKAKVEQSTEIGQFRTEEEAKPQDLEVIVCC
jgi:hypothetical protein